MEPKHFGLDDIVEMKKSHPCGDNRMQIIRMGADIRIKCLKCGHSILLSRAKFESKLKKVLVKAAMTESPEEQVANVLPQTKNVAEKKEKKTERSTFPYPSTGIPASTGGSKVEVPFEETSELYRLGYRITGLKRSERRRILVQVAIPKLGMEKVVNTIASHVRNRKRQVNGSVIYRHAIAEWEDDLAYLKNHIYNQNFR